MPIAATSSMLLASCALVLATAVLRILGQPAVVNQCSFQNACVDISFNMLADECASGNCMWEVCVNFDSQKCPRPLGTGYVCTQAADCTGTPTWTDHGDQSNFTECQAGLPGEQLSFAIFQEIACQTFSPLIVRNFESSLGRPLDSVVTCNAAAGPIPCGAPIPWTFVPFCMWSVTLPSNCIDIPNSPTPSPSPSFSPNATESPSPIPSGSESPSSSPTPSPSPAKGACWMVNGTEWCWDKCGGINGTNGTNATNATDCLEEFISPSHSPRPAEPSPSSEGPTFEVYPSDSPSPEGPTFEVYPSDSPSPEGPTFEIYPSDSPSPQGPEFETYPSPSPDAAPQTP